MESQYFKLWIEYTFPIQHSGGSRVSQTGAPTPRTSLALSWIHQYNRTLNYFRAVNCNGSKLMRLIGLIQKTTNILVHFLVQIMDSTLYHRFTLSLLGPSLL